MSKDKTTQNSFSRIKKLSNLEIENLVFNVLVNSGISLKISEIHKIIRKNYIQGWEVRKACNRLLAKEKIIINVCLQRKGSTYRISYER